MFLVPGIGLLKRYQSKQIALKVIAALLQVYMKTPILPFMILRITRWNCHKNQTPFAATSVQTDGTWGKGNGNSFYPFAGRWQV
jgi:hypothetical protein